MPLPEGSASLWPASSRYDGQLPRRCSTIRWMEKPCFFSDSKRVSFLAKLSSFSTFFGSAEQVVEFSASSRSLPKSNFHAVTRRVYREKQCNIVVCCFLGCCCYYCTELVSIHRSEEVFDHLQTVSPLLLHSSFDDGNEHDVKAHRRECTATGPENL